MYNRLRLLIILALLGSFALYSWRGLGEVFSERGRYTDALGLVPAAITPMSFAVPSLSELAVRYNLERTQANCSLCHIGKETSGVFNPFGRDYQMIVQRLLDETVPADSPEARSIFQLNITQVRQALAETTRDGLDSDGDGFDNDLELLFGFLPGVAGSKPSLSVTEMDSYRTRLRHAGRTGELEALLRRPPTTKKTTDTTQFFGFPVEATPLVRLERLALYKQALAP